MARDLASPINYIYLIQEREFIKTKENIYKIGMTTKENHKRFNQYPKGSLILFQMICENCRITEKRIIKKFGETFNQRKDIGTEYFEGDYSKMIDIIYLTIREENNDTTDDISSSESLSEDEMEYEDWVRRVKNKSYQERAFKKVCEELSEIFPNYKKDVVFGGSQKLIKFNDDGILEYINPELKKLYFKKDGSVIEDHESFYCNIENCKYLSECPNPVKIKSYEIIKEFSFIYGDLEEFDYFNSMMEKSIVSPGKIYDLNSTSFIKKMNNTKMKIKIDNCDDFIAFHNVNDNTHDLLHKLFYFNLIINDKIYGLVSTRFFENSSIIDNFDYIIVYLDLKGIHTTMLYKINGRYYDYRSFLRKYFPYRIIWKDEEYYAINRDKEIIGGFTPAIKRFVESGDKMKEEILFLAKNPWQDKESYLEFQEKYRKCVRDNGLKIFLNSNEYIEKALNLM